MSIISRDYPEIEEAINASEMSTDNSVLDRYKTQENYDSMEVILYMLESKANSEFHKCELGIKRFLGILGAYTAIVILANLFHTPIEHNPWFLIPYFGTFALTAGTLADPIWHAGNTQGYTKLQKRVYDSKSKLFPGTARHRIPNEDII